MPRAPPARLGAAGRRWRDAVGCGTRRGRRVFGGIARGRRENALALMGGLLNASRRVSTDRGDVTGVNGPSRGRGARGTEAPGVIVGTVGAGHPLANAEGLAAADRRFTPFNAACLERTGFREQTMMWLQGAVSLHKEQWQPTARQWRPQQHK